MAKRIVITESAIAQRAADILAAAPNRTVAQWAHMVNTYGEIWQDNDHVDDMDFRLNYDAVIRAHDIATAREDNAPC
jgi:hypothetical protein